MATKGYLSFSTKVFDKELSEAINSIMYGYGIVTDLQLYVVQLELARGFPDISDVKYLVRNKSGSIYKFWNGRDLPTIPYNRSYFYKKMVRGIFDDISTNCKT